MLYRNLLAMEAEELLRSQPIDGAVLMAGCDKTTPALIMAGTTTDLPFLVVPAGPMLRGNWRGNVLGSGSDSWKYWDELRAGTIDEQAWREVETGIARSFGQCMTMGTASTMTSVTEAMGLTLSGASSIPAPDASHPRMATASGKRIVDMVWEDLKPSELITEASVDNGIVTAMVLGGSTNAVIHITAMARRAGIDVDLDRYDRISRRVPTLANIRPSGAYLMEDFYYAGGLRALLSQVADLLDTTALTVDGRTLGENLEGAEIFDEDVIKPRSTPLFDEGGLAVLRGNLAPDGCVIAAGRSCSRTTTTWRHGSTTRTSRSTRTRFWCFALPGR